MRDGAAPPSVSAMSRGESGSPDMVMVRSAWPFDVTLERLCAAIPAAGYRVFAQVDHAANAAHVSLELRPTTLILLGRPEVGTALMLDRQAAGIDLPSRILVHQDEEGRVWLTYTTGSWLVRRHGLSSVGTEAAMAVQAALERMCAQAAGSA